MLQPVINKDRRSRHGREEHLPVIQIIHNCFKDAVEYRTYRLDNQYTLYDHTVSKNIAKMSKRFSTQMKPHTFDPFDTISIIGFLFNFQLACDTDGIHEGAAIKLFHFFMKKSASSALHTKLTSKNSRNDKTHALSGGNATQLTTYQQVVNHLLQKYATDEVVANTEEEITSFTQPANKTANQYAEDLDAETLRCGNIYDARTMNEIVIK